MAEKDIKTMTDAQIGTELMSLKNSKEGIEARIRMLIEEADARGYAGKNIPTVGGDYVVALSSGKENKLNMEKACNVLGAEVVAGLLEAKRKSIVALTVSDLGTLATKDIKAQICDVLDATIKATVRKNKD